MECVFLILLQRERKRERPQAAKEEGAQLFSESFFWFVCICPKSERAIYFFLRASNSLSSVWRAEGEEGGMSHGGFKSSNTGKTTQKIRPMASHRV